MSKSQTVAAPGAGRERRALRESSNCPQTSHARPRRVNTVAGGRRRARRCGGEQEAEARERPQPALDRDAVGARQPIDVEHRAAAGRLQQLQQRAGRAGHRDVARGVAEPRLGDLDERVAVVAQALGRAVAQRA